jgi:recombinational DNA repair protein RecR
MAQGARTLLYKEVLNRLETESPGTKHMFYWGFLEKHRKTQTSVSMMDKDRSTLHSCSLCGQPTTAETCSYCKLMARAKVSPSL